MDDRILEKFWDENSEMLKETIMKKDSIIMGSNPYDIYVMSICGVMVKTPSGCALLKPPDYETKEERKKRKFKEKLRQL